MGNREPGEIRTDIVWDPNVLARVADACEDNGLDGVADQLRGYLNPPKDVALVRDIFERVHDNAGPWRELEERLMAGLADLGWRRSDKIIGLVETTLIRMQELPWSGDHLYGDALTDAATVLKHVLAGGKGWPVLERFRCPSQYQAPKDAGGQSVRCVRQLPHENTHSTGDGFEWTDEQSTNPPKAYDSDAEELSGHPVRKADRIPAADLCAAKRTTAGLVLRCGLYPGHDGEHQDDGSMARWL